LCLTGRRPRLACSELRLGRREDVFVPAELTVELLCRLRVSLSLPSSIRPSFGKKLGFSLSVPRCLTSIGEIFDGLRLGEELLSALFIPARPWDISIR
jgi:hypothetical protein